MILKIYSVYDGVVETFNQPWFAQNRAHALRIFGDSVSSGDSMMNRHPGDYTLFEIGVYDDQTGDIEPYQSKVNLGLAIEFIES